MHCLCINVIIILEVENMSIYKSGEDYLERILMLQEKNGSVRAIDIAESMEYSRASVSIALKKLKNDELINVSGDSIITLTEKGKKTALEIYEKHKYITSFLIHLGVNENIALEDACKIEHDLSIESFEKLKEFCIKNNIVK